LTQRGALADKVYEVKGATPVNATTAILYRPRKSMNNAALMTEVESDAARPDPLVLAAVLSDARRFVSGGLAISEAARRASRGLWSPYRGPVERQLQAEHDQIAVNCAA